MAPSAESSQGPIPSALFAKPIKKDSQTPPLIVTHRPTSHIQIKLLKSDYAALSLKRL